MYQKYGQLKLYLFHRYILSGIRIAALGHRDRIQSVVIQLRGRGVALHGCCRGRGHCRFAKFKSRLAGHVTQVGVQTNGTFAIHHEM